MHITRSLIQHILKTKSIVNYLENKGHAPVKQLSAGRLSYLCPLPWHSETKPSFVVYTNGEFENFYCFGCGSKYHIIHLVSFLESIPVRSAIEKLADGAEFSIIDDEKLEQQSIIDFVDSSLVPSKTPTAELSKTLIEISDICLNYLKGVGYDEAEKKRINGIWTLLDAYLRDFEFDKIEQSRRSINALLMNQRKLYLKKYLEEKSRVKY